VATGFVQQERAHQSAFHRSDWFGSAAKAPGVVILDNGTSVGPLSFCLPREEAGENLFRGIRARVLAYFAEREIAWHMETPQGPSNHMLDSQVCCLNFLAPFMNRPDTLQKILQPVFGEVTEVKPVCSSEPYVAFEWIGLADHLGEWFPGADPIRGRGVTSADAAVRFIDRDGRDHLVLVEWKYTESYPESEDPGAMDKLHEPRRGEVRRQRYEDLLRTPGGPIHLFRVDYEDLFFEPLYQLMRQQLLASAIEESAEDDVDVCSVLHVSPRANEALKRVTPLPLRDRYDDPDLYELWPTLLHPSADGAPRFRSVAAPDLFGARPWEQMSEMTDWWQYVSDRYAGLLT